MESIDCVYGHKAFILHLAFYESMLLRGGSSLASADSGSPLFVFETKREQILSTPVQPDASLRVRSWAVSEWQRIHRGQPLGALAGTAPPGHAWGPRRGNSLGVQSVALAEEMRWATARDALGLAGLANRKHPS